MLEQIKKEILYSKEISNLIYSGVVELIILGGSRILGLDSPSSDYDICIYVNSGQTHNPKDWTWFSIPTTNRIHYKLISIKSLLKDLSNDNVINNAHYYNLLHLTIASNNNDFIIYSSNKIKPFLRCLQSNSKPLICLALENLMNHMRAWLSLYRPFTRYSKSMYHYLSFYYLGLNYLKTNSLSYTTEQKDILLTAKTTKTIPTGFIELFDNKYILNPFTCMYYYKPIWEEVINTYGQTYVY